MPVIRKRSFLEFWPVVRAGIRHPRRSSVNQQDQTFQRKLVLWLGKAAENPAAEVEHQLESRLQAECANCGLPRIGRVRTDVQANWLSGGLDVTVTAFVQVGKGAAMRKLASVPVGAAKVRKAS